MPIQQGMNQQTPAVQAAIFRIMGGRRRVVRVVRRARAKALSRALRATGGTMTVRQANRRLRMIDRDIGAGQRRTARQLREVRRLDRYSAKRSRKRRARLVKGSAAAKRYMAKIRRMRKR